jgi:hypothetical protein
LDPRQQSNAVDTTFVLAAIKNLQIWLSSAVLEASMILVKLGEATATMASTVRFQSESLQVAMKPAPKAAIRTTAAPALLATFLNWWTRVCAIRAEHATVTLKRLDNDVAVRALQTIGRHRGHYFTFRKAALRTGQRGVQGDGLQFAVPTTVDG